MVQKHTLPQVGVRIHPEEDDMLYALSLEYKLPKTTIARALFRAGAQVFHQAPREILALADSKGVTA